ncbi:TPA: Chitinase 2 [Trebouxia sp. C0005]
MLGFLGSFGLSQDLTQAQNFVNIAFHSLSETQAGIASCQAAGKPVILSIGGAASNYGFTSTADAQNAATQIWSIYLGGTSSIRPFGTSVLDGMDLDIEASTGSQNHAAFVDQLQSLWGGASKKYYLTAVPQCPYPDANLGAVLSSHTSAFDYVLIQFYNNYCEYGSSDNAVVSSFQQWAGLIPAAKLAPASPASTAAAGSGLHSTQCHCADIA